MSSNSVGSNVLPGTADFTRDFASLNLFNSGIETNYTISTNCFIRFNTTIQHRSTSNDKNFHIDLKLYYIELPSSICTRVNKTKDLWKCEEHMWCCDINVWNLWRPFHTVPEYLEYSFSNCTQPSHHSAPRPWPYVVGTWHIAYLFRFVRLLRAHRISFVTQLLYFNRCISEVVETTNTEQKH